MPGRFFQTRPIGDVADWLGVWPPEFHAPPRSNIAPGEDIVVLASDRRLVRMRWGLIPVGRKNARGRPVLETIINARSETVFEKSAFDGVGRAVVPAEGWYEWTGERRKKTAWRFRLRGAPFLAFAAITDKWEAPGGRTLEQVATVTTEPNGDVKPIHHRMGVLLARDAIDIWLSGSPAEAKAVCQPWPDGALRIDEAGDVDWKAP